MELGWGLTKLLVLPLYISCILAIILTLFYRIEIGVFFLILFLPLQNILNHLIDLPLGKDINDILLIALLGKWVIDKLKTNESLFVKTSLNLPIFLFLLWTFIEIWWGALYFRESLELSLANPRVIYWKNLIRMPLLYLIIVNNIKNPDHKKLIVFFIIIAIIILNRNFYNIAMWQDFSQYSNEQKVGSFAQKLGGNALAVFLAMYVVVLLSLFLHTRHLGLNRIKTFPICTDFGKFLLYFIFIREKWLSCCLCGLCSHRIFKRQKSTCSLNCACLRLAVIIA